MYLHSTVFSQAQGQLCLFTYNSKSIQGILASVLLKNVMTVVSMHNILQ